MPGTRTAPDPSVAAVTQVISTIHLIDASGDVTTDAIVTSTAPTAAEQEAWIAAYQDATQASCYQFSSLLVWEGDADPDNALTGSRDSIKDGINLLYRNIATLRSTTPRLVAPVAATMQGNQDIPLLSSAEMTALITAELAMLTGFDLQSAQYTERSERSNNPRIKA